MAPKLLGDSTALARRFLSNQQNPDGGFKDRSGKSDLYYTVFGVDALMALEAPDPAARPVSASAESCLRGVEAFAAALGDGAGLDFVHLCCLARCWAQGGRGKTPPETARLFGRIEEFRSRDGGFSPSRAQERGTVYGCFLGLGAYQDLAVPIPDPQGLLRCLANARTPDGAWTNAFPESLSDGGPPLAGSTNATAAAIAVLRGLGSPVPASALAWLAAREHPQGGFVAAPNSPLPDLLSTATALHAMAGHSAYDGQFKERCLDFLDSLWTNVGGFHGHWADEVLDCEYTFYGLLALGHLSVLD